MVTSPQHIGALQNQPENTNNLLDTRFQVRISKLPNLRFNCQSVSIPGLAIQVARQETRFNTMYYPAQQIEHEPLHVRFIVDEDLVTYKAIWDWLKECVAYDNFAAVTESVNDVFAEDLTVSVLDSNQNLTHTFRFAHAFPISLGSLDFTASNVDATPIIIDVRFQYTTYSFSTEE